MAPFDALPQTHRNQEDPSLRCVYSSSHWPDVDGDQSSSELAKTLLTAHRHKGSAFVDSSDRLDRSIRAGISVLARACARPCYLAKRQGPEHMGRLKDVDSGKCRKQLTSCERATV